MYLWFGLLGIFFSASGITVESLTSWDIAAQSIFDIISNPFKLISIVGAIIGTLVNPNTKGMKD